MYVEMKQGDWSSFARRMEKPKSGTGTTTGVHWETWNQFRGEIFLDI